MPVAEQDVLRVTVNGNNAGLGALDAAYNIRLISETTLSDGAALDSLLAVFDQLYGYVAPVISSNLNIENIRVLNLTQDTIIGDFNLTDTTPGTNASNRHPPQVAGCITFTTTTVGVRGRKFFGPVTVTGYDTNGAIQTLATDALTDVGDMMDGNVVDDTNVWRFGVMSSKVSAFVPFTGYIIKQRAATQRRRVVGVGE